MTKNRMDVPAFAGKLLEESHIDLPREGVRILAQASHLGVQGLADPGDLTLGDPVHA